MSKLRIGIIGCGGISAAHIGAYGKLPEEVAIVAFCDAVRESAAMRAAGTDAAVYSDWAEMLQRERLDAISVCTPPSTHREIVVAALEQGLPVLCEKPLAGGIEDARAMVAVAERTGKLLMPAFCHRFHPPVLALKELLASGALGTPFLFRNMFGGKANMESNHRAVKALAGGGVLVDNSSHAMDMFRYLVGEVYNVSARAATVAQKMETEDLGAILFEGPARCMGTVISTYSIPVFDNNVEVFGSEGTAVIQYWGADLRYQKAGEKEWTVISGAGKPDRFAAEIAHFVRCVRGEEQPITTPRDGLRVQEVMGAVYRAAEGQVWENCGPGVNA